MRITDYGQEIYYKLPDGHSFDPFPKLYASQLTSEQSHITTTVNVRTVRAHPRGIQLSPGALYNNRQKHRIRKEQKTRTRCQLGDDQHTQAWTNTQFVKDLLFIQHKEVETWFKITLMILCFIVAALLGVMVK